MGYFNPIYAYGTERFAADAAESGVDGVIVVDLPPEEERELLEPARRAGLHLIHLVTPTTDDVRLSTVLENAGGFVYYVSIAGITGSASADPAKLEPAVAAIRKNHRCPLPWVLALKRPRMPLRWPVFVMRSLSGLRLSQTWPKPMVLMKR